MEELNQFLKAPGLSELFAVATDGGYYLFPQLDLSQGLASACPSLRTSLFLKKLFRLWQEGLQMACRNLYSKYVILSIDSSGKTGKEMDEKTEFKGSELIFQQSTFLSSLYCFILMFLSCRPFPFFKASDVYISLPFPFSVWEYRDASCKDVYL